MPVHDQVWPTTIERWRSEGLPPDVSPADYFGFEMVLLRCDLSPRFPAEVVEESDEYVLERTAYGAVRRQHSDRSTTPEVLDWPVRTREDWDRIKPRLQPDSMRVDWEDVRAKYQASRREGKFITFAAHIGFAQFLEYISTDELLVLMATDAGWVKEMFQVHAELVVGMAEIMMAGDLRFDGAFLECDLGYRNATFFSPRMYRDLQFPSDRMVFHFFRDRGVPVLLHSDGCMKALIPQLLEAGISALHPLEVKAGMDLIELKREYGQDLTFVGGIDTRLMANPDSRLIEDEIRRKFEVAMVGGGYIYHSDHSVPHNVSFTQYCRVLEFVNKYGTYQ